MEKEKEALEKRLREAGLSEAEIEQRFEERDKASARCGFYSARIMDNLEKYALLLKEAPFPFSQPAMRRRVRNLQRDISNLGECDITGEGQEKLKKNLVRIVDDVIKYRETGDTATLVEAKEKIIDLGKDLLDQLGKVGGVKPGE